MRNLIIKLRKFYKVIIIAADVFIILGSYILLYLIKFNGQLPYYNFVPFINAIPLIIIAAIIYLDLYKVVAFYRCPISHIAKSITTAITMLALTTTTITYMLQGFSFPRTVLIITPLVQIILLVSFHTVLLYLSKKFAVKKNIMIIHHNKVDKEDRILNKLKDFIGKDKIQKLYILSSEDTRIIDRKLNEMDEVFLCNELPAQFKEEIIESCLGKKQIIYIVPEAFEILLANSRIIQFDDTPGFVVDRLGLTSEQKFFKRMFDICLSVLGLLVLSPLLLVTAIAVKITSPGPVIFKQQRVTQNNKVFEVYKFRTMSVDAEEGCGPILAEENDTRVTPVGRFLRRSRIDELPQLFNVIKGDMSIVGPRPERPFFVSQFLIDIPEYNSRFVAKAGITGYAQLFGNYDTSPEDKLRYDIMYLTNYSLYVDIKLILKTFSVILRQGSFSSPDTRSKNSKDQSKTKTQTPTASEDKEYEKVCN